MQENYSDSSLTLEKTAENFQTTEQAAYSFFKEHFNKSFASLLEEMRINNSLMMLQRPEAKINHVAAKSGYNSSHSFRRAFKRVLGYTPSEYKDKLHRE